jgi:aquaporin Z
MRDALRQHWPEYLMEAAGLGIFMLSAGVFATILEYPGFPVRELIDQAWVRRCLMGLAMGLTAVAIIYSPWGKQSGAHINPAVTLTFYRLGKIKTWDAQFYIVAQFFGGAFGILIVALALGANFSAPEVNYVATVPGPNGAAVAFFAEFVLSFVLMMVILLATNNQKLARFTGLFAGLLLVVYITIEAPYSGMSINPARSFASALPGWLWTGFWIYLSAPTLGMLFAAQVYIRQRGKHGVKCAKLHHHNNKRCIFNCGYRSEKKLKIGDKNDR